MGRAMRTMPATISTNAHRRQNHLPHHANHQAESKVNTRSTITEVFRYWICLMTIPASCLPNPFPNGYSPTPVIERPFRAAGGTNKSCDLKLSLSLGFLL